MKCIECGEEMDLIYVDDNPNRDYAYNIFSCTHCMVICHNNVWRNRGNIWIYPNHKVTKEDL